jgi:hypothetical protein
VRDFGLEGDVGLVDSDVLGERTDTQVARAGIDLVTDLEVLHFVTDSNHDARDVVSEYEWCLVLQQALEFAVTDHPVQRLDARCHHTDQDVTRADAWLRDFGGTEAALAIPLDHEGLQDRRPLDIPLLIRWPNDRAEPQRIMFSPIQASRRSADKA